MRPDLEPAVVRARELHSPDPLEWRRRIERELPEIEAADIREVISQAELAQRAADTWGIHTAWWLTRDGLEQGTHPRVADLRAQHIAATGATHVIDLTAGLGFDTAACLRAGLEVTSVERDPVIAEYCAHNNPGATVICADAQTFLEHSPPSATDVLLVDPARRTGVRTTSGARALPERDPQQWSPATTLVEKWAHGNRVAMKAAPSFMGIHHGLEHWSVQWVARERTLVESAWYSWTLPIGETSAAVVTASNITEFPSNDVTLNETGSLTEGAIIVEVNDAVARAHAWPVDETWTRINDTWLCAPSDISSLTWGRRYRVVAENVARKNVPLLLRERGVTRAAIKTMVRSDDPARLRAQWKIADDDRHALVVFGDQVVLVERMRTPSK